MNLSNSPTQTAGLVITSIITDAEGVVGGVHVESEKSLSKYEVRVRPRRGDVTVNDMAYDYIPVWMFTDSKGNQFFGTLRVEEIAKKLAPSTVVVYGEKYTCKVVWKIALTSSKALYAAAPASLSLSKVLKVLAVV